MHIEQAMEILKSGYCLWVGAGISLQLAGEAGGVPTWKKLVQELEQEVQVKNEYPESLDIADFDYPERLTIIFKQMGRYEFAVAIRKKILEQLAIAILKNAEDHLQTNDLPLEFKQVAILGNLANPIVNFNVETLSSCALAGVKNQDFCLKVFKIPDVDDDLGKELSDGPHATSHKRHVFHPHGAINAHGRCILTSNEYSSLVGTLAYQLSTHAAFHSNLVIVGMSLQDHYLRAQLSEFRQQIGKILWFMTKDEHAECERSLLKDAFINNITIVKFDHWKTFWSAIQTVLPNPNKERLVKTYQSLLSQSIGLLEWRAGQLVRLSSDITAIKADTVEVTEDKRAEMEYYVRRASVLISAKHRGESWSQALDKDKLDLKKQVINEYIKRLNSM